MPWIQRVERGAECGGENRWVAAAPWPDGARGGAAPQTAMGISLFICVLVRPGTSEQMNTARLLEATEFDRGHGGQRGCLWDPRGPQLLCLGGPEQGPDSSHGVPPVRRAAKTTAS